MSKTIKSAILAILLGGILLFIGFRAMQYFSMKEMNENGRQLNCQGQIQESFMGEIKTINRYEYSSYMNENFFGIEIKVSETPKKTISYQFVLKENGALLKTAKIGQSVTKKSGNDFFRLLDAEKVEHKFNVPDCR